MHTIHTLCTPFIHYAHHSYTMHTIHTYTMHIPYIHNTCPTQYAYRPNVSTTDALLQYIDDYTTFLDKQKVKFVQGACLDFSKAFDRLQPSVVLGENEILRL